MAEPTLPCRYCIANWRGMNRGHTDRPEILPTAEDCSFEHRDDPRVYALAAELARAFCGAPVTDEQTGWFLADADDVIDDFNPTPKRWSARRFGLRRNDAEDGIDARVRINGVMYVAMEGGKGVRGSLLTLAKFREARRG